MKQYTYVFDDANQFLEITDTLGVLLEENPNTQSILQVISPTGIREKFEDSLIRANDLFPNTTIYGMTSQGPILENPIEAEEDDRKGICSLIIFEESGYFAKGFDCHNISVKDAGLEFVAELKKLSDIKGVLLMTSDIRLYSDDFVNCILEEYPDIPVFGAMAGSQDMAKDYSLVYMKKEIYNRGIIAIAFYGENLNIITKNSLGWRSLGKEFTITKSTPDGFVQEIDDKPAIEAYTEFLGVAGNKYFYENTSAFPILFKQNGKLVGRVALLSNNGAVLYTMQIPVGTKASFAYARKKYLLGESLANANAMIPFNPEAIIVFSCMTRKNFMGDSLANKEFSYYRNVCPGCTWSGGYGEFLYAENGAGLLNGTLIAIGFREGEVKEPSKVIPMEEEELGLKKNQFLPLMERMINLLEKTTDDLRENMDKLYYYANHDALTGICNRAAFNDTFRNIIDNMTEDSSIALIMMDIDHFKVVNDNYGHDIGDEVLKKTVNYIKEILPECSAFCRWGGEELIAILQDKNKEQALAIAEEIREHIEKSDFTPVEKLTISIGVTLINKDLVNNYDPFKIVDNALYEAKDTGRNKVVFK